MRLLGVVTRPGTSRQNKTGSWRVMRPVFDHDKCTGCTTCETICPEGCVYHTGKTEYDSDLDYCKGCGLCAEMCPADAITMKEEIK
ncbi:MAG: 4Fe-4S dicluster domain-containing protein [Armatimonadetes bacterium]|nr:4Fe-4S dicluster domain-containing protein [Armatimonadota bacterium]NIO74888.1 4Fe-4S dicluster domain-containing protein [Armatimonadota bacterium]NIO95649.1 4Fe-4S dicluster domain-containing protein [Armatimonadota bacterium]